MNTFTPLALEELIDNFIQSINLKSSSKITYKSQMKLFAHWLQKNGISSCNTQTIIDYSDHLKKDKKLSDLSIHGYLTAIKSFFAWLQSKNIYVDIAKTVQGPQRLAGRKKDSLSPQQLKDLLNAIDRKSIEGKRDFALINLLIWTGLRCREITQISRGDIANCCDSQLLWIQTSDGNGKNESIQLANKLYKPIMDYLEARKSISDTDPLFASHSKKNFGQPLTERSVSRIIKNRLKAAKIDLDGVSLSSLRYTAIRLNLLIWATPDQVDSMIKTIDLNSLLIVTRHLKNKQI